MLYKISCFQFLFLFIFNIFPLFSLNLEKIDLLESGFINYALAEWWLDKDKSNMTEALQSALSSGADFVTITDIDQSWITEPLFLESDTTVFFDRGVIIEAKKDSYRGKGDSLFSALNKQNISLIGYGAVLKMRRADYTYPPYEEGQWRHVISLKSCSDIEIRGLSLLDSGGDGIYIGVLDDKGQNYCDNLYFKDLRISGNYRQGISVISAVNLLIEDCLIENTGNHLPSAGIDFEPNSEDEFIDNCIIKDTVFKNNFGPGILFFLASLDDRSYPVHAEIINCKSYTNRRPISIRKIAGGKKGYIVLDNNLFIGFKGIDDSTDEFKVIWQ